MAQASAVTPNIVVLDASVWISRLLPQDSNHPRARLWVDEHIDYGGRFVAPTLLVIETAATASRNTGDPVFALDASRRLYLLPMIDIVQLDQTLVNNAVSIAANYGVKTADSVYVSMAKSLNIPLVTFDKDVIKRVSQMVTVIEPQ